GVGYLALRPDPSAPPGSPRPRPLVPLAALAAAVLVTAVTSGFESRPGPDHPRTFWSPYYRIDYDPHYSPRSAAITTNRIAHQVIVPTDMPTQAGYALP